MSSDLILLGICNYTIYVLKISHLASLGQIRFRLILVFVIDKWVDKTKNIQ
jgi:hypothetical protein